jgi:hypothetical protein
MYGIDEYRLCLSKCSFQSRPFVCNDCPCTKLENTLRDVGRTSPSPHDSKKETCKPKLEAATCVVHLIADSFLSLLCLSISVSYNLSCLGLDIHTESSNSYASSRCCLIAGMTILLVTSLSILFLTRSSNTSKSFLDCVKSQSSVISPNTFCSTKTK